MAYLFALGFSSFYRVFTAFAFCFIKFYFVLLGFTGFYWVLPGLHLFVFLILLCFTWFYWVLLGFIGFYWVLLGFTGFYWVLIDHCVDCSVADVACGVIARRRRRTRSIGSRTRAAGALPSPR